MESDSGPVALGGQTTIGLPARRILFDEPVPQIADYRLIKPIGRGAFGTVWLAEESLIGAFRAVKVLSGRSVTQPSPAVNRPVSHAERELEGVHAYQTRVKEHPHLVRVFKTGLCRILPLPSGEGRGDGKSPLPLGEGQGEGVRTLLEGRGEGRTEGRTFVYYVMEIADHAGGPQPHRPEDYEPLTLATMIRRRGRLPAETVVQYARNLLDAIEHLHAAGIHHRDIKPSNCLFVGGELKLADIGLVSDDTQELIGTTGYLPPEGKPDDLYALGKVMYEMLTGLSASAFPEWPGDLGDSGSHSTNSLDARFLSHVRDVINRLCHPMPEKRLARAAQVADEIDRIVTTESSRRRTPRLLALVLVFISIAVGVFGALSWRDQADPIKHSVGRPPYDGSESRQVLVVNGRAFELARQHSPDQLFEFMVRQTPLIVRDLQTSLFAPDPIHHDIGPQFAIAGSFQIYNRENPTSRDVTIRRGEIDQLFVVARNWNSPDPHRCLLLYHGEPGPEPGVRAGFRRNIPLDDVLQAEGSSINIYLVLMHSISPDDAVRRIEGREWDSIPKVLVASVTRPWQTSGS